MEHSNNGNMFAKNAMFMRPPAPCIVVCEHPAKQRAELVFLLYLFFFLVVIPLPSLTAVACY